MCWQVQDKANAFHVGTVCLVGNKQMKEHDFPLIFVQIPSSQ